MTLDSRTKCNNFVLNSPIFFAARDLITDWGWGFTSPQPLPNPLLSLTKCNFRLTIQKKGDRSLPEINYFCVVNMYHQLTVCLLLIKNNIERVADNDLSISTIGLNICNSRIANCELQIQVLESYNSILPEIEMFQCTDIS